jgi:hypothetical protein
MRRSPRATTDWQNSQTVTIDEPILKVTDAPQAGQEISMGLNAI